MFAVSQGGAAVSSERVRPDEDGVLHIGRSVVFTPLPVERTLQPVPLMLEVRPEAADAAEVDDLYALCHKPLDCGGLCFLFNGHDGDCLCEGDEDGERSRGGVGPAGDTGRSDLGEEDTLLADDLAEITKERAKRLKAGCGRHVAAF